MIITLAGFKGGNGKTTAAIHLAGYLQKLAPTLLIDGDQNASALAWASRGGLPFPVLDERAARPVVRDHTHVIIDTQVRPTPNDLRALASGCDPLILPVTHDVLSLRALAKTVEALGHHPGTPYKALLNIIPPSPQRDGEEARASIARAGLRLFKGEVRRRVAFQKAALAAVFVNEVNDPRAAECWEDFVSIGKEIVK
jgi:chromosome partitioning protein